MMRVVSRGCGMLLAVCFLSVAGRGGWADETEPPQLYYIEAGGKRIPIELNRPFDPSAFGTKATLRVEPYREFDFAGVQFRYPREYAFHYATAPNVRMWNLTGFNCVIMVHRYTNQPDIIAFHRTFIETLLKQYEGKGEESDCSLKLHDRTLGFVSKRVFHVDVV